MRPVKEERADISAERQEILATLIDAYEQQRTAILVTRTHSGYGFIHSGLPSDFAPDWSHITALEHAGKLIVTQGRDRLTWTITIPNDVLEETASASDRETHSTVTPSMTPQNEAAQLLSEVTAALTSTPRDVVAIFRKCLHASQLIEDKQASEWFEQELNGYYSPVTVPDYRKVQGTTLWRSRGFDNAGDPKDLAAYQIRRQMGNPETQMEIRNGIDWIASRQEHGFYRFENESGVWWPGILPGTVGTFVQRVEFYSPSMFRHVISTVEHLTFRWAVNWRKTLIYGNAVTDIWTQYRATVEKVLSAAGLKTHLDSIQANLSSNNPSQWRSTVYACRSVLEDLSAYLWQDSRPTYEHLPSGDGKGPLVVTKERAANRIGAYLHQQGLAQSEGKFMREEARRLADSIRNLLSLQAKAHGAIEKQHAQSVAIQTYILVGEIAQRTDFQPVTEYRDPGGTRDSDTVERQ